MKTFIKISEDTILNTNNIIKITKYDTNLGNNLSYCIDYYTIDNKCKKQHFNSKEERDIFFRNICDDLIY